MENVPHAGAQEPDCVEPMQRQRAQTLPARTLSRLRGRGTLSQNVNTLKPDGNSNSSNFVVHKESHKDELTPQRARAHTVPTAVLRKLKQGAAIAARSRDTVTSNVSIYVNDVCVCGENKSHENVPTRAKIDDHYDDKNDSIPTVEDETSAKFSAVELIDKCIHQADDESMTVYREPLPRGSCAFEKVLHHFEPHPSDDSHMHVPGTATQPTHSILHNSKAHSCVHTSHGSSMGRHVHW